MTGALKNFVLNASTALGGKSVAIGQDNDTEPQYELFHAANSICSQKVRCVLTHHSIPYVSHLVNLFQGQTYLPDYIRLRMKGCDQIGGVLAAVHGGTTSTESGGCDAAVVPTLVDWAAGEVMVDSKRICLHIDGQMPGTERLRPIGLAAEIDAELTIVDNLPNYQMLMGRSSGAAEAEESRADTHSAFSLRKVAWCDNYLKEHEDDDVLTRAYTAKRSKELSAADHLFSPEAMRKAYSIAEDSLRGLETKLEERKTPWLFGDALTMADLFWGIELVRMKDVGTASFWEGGRLPFVERFYAASEALPAILSAITEWSGARF
ncbi:MAG: glutathione S-transferase family protein [Bradyrhizobium sp.]|nr:glutathione S-transferase family protein [Bradyrhizobium sp.]